MTSYDTIISRLEGATGADNELDIAVDIALFHPDERHDAVRANAAGTKLVYTRRGGGTDTFLATDHTLNETTRRNAIALMRALKAKEGVK